MVASMRSLVSACLCGAFAGCASGTPRAVAEPHGASIPLGPVPAWVLKTPRRSGSVCATGAVDPTYYRQDGRVFAAESARNELARTLEVRVTSVMYDEQTTSGSFVDQAFVSQVAGSLSEVVLSGAEVSEYWFDEHGQVSRKGMTYALACMQRDSSVAELVERMKSAATSDEEEVALDQVRQRAERAFDELEQMESAGR